MVTRTSPTNNEKNGRINNPCRNSITNSNKLRKPLIYTLLVIVTICVVRLTQIRHSLHYLDGTTVRIGSNDNHDAATTKSKPTYKTEYDDQKKKKNSPVPTAKDENLTLGSPPSSQLPLSYTPISFTASLLSDMKTQHDNDVDDVTEADPAFSTIQPPTATLPDNSTRVWNITRLLVRSRPDNNVKEGTTRVVPICANAKAGSTSFYNKLYNLLFNGTDWPYEGRPAIQGVTRGKKAKERWGGNFNQSKYMYLSELLELVNDDHNSGGSTNSPTSTTDTAPFSLAIVRDPKKRLISAWKSKAACPELGLGTDVHDLRVVETFKLINGYYERKNFTNITTAQQSSPKSCLSFEEFLDLLYQIHTIGLETKLDLHFRPQHLRCFQYVPPSRWSFVGTIGNPNLLKLFITRGLGRNISSMSQSVTMPKVHASLEDSNTTHKVPSDFDKLSKHYQDILDGITRDEYKSFSDFL